MKLSPDDSRWVNCLRASAESLKDSVLPYKLYSVEEKILAMSLVAGQFYLYTIFFESAKVGLDK